LTTKVTVNKLIKNPCGFSKLVLNEGVYSSVDLSGYFTALLWRLCDKDTRAKQLYQTKEKKGRRQISTDKTPSARE